MSEAIERLAQLVRAQGGLLAQAVSALSANGDTIPRSGHGPVAAAGPRAAVDCARYELLVEAIREGYLLHYGQPRVVSAEDSDLALLAGDQLYALGLAELAELGDLDAVSELADVISLSAQAQAAADDELADAVWDAGAAAVGWGTSDAHERAKELARAGDRGAARALRDATPPAAAKLARRQ